MHRVALWEAARADRPAVVYLHPYELDTHEIESIAKHHHVPWKLRLSQSLGRGDRLEHRIERLRRGRALTTMGDSFRALEARRDLPTA